MFRNSNTISYMGVDSVFSIYSNYKSVAGDIMYERYDVFECHFTGLVSAVSAGADVATSDTMWPPPPHPVRLEGVESESDAE